MSCVSRHSGQLGRLASFFVIVSSAWLATMVRLFFFQAEDGIRDLVRSRGLGDVYKRQVQSGS